MSTRGRHDRAPADELSRRSLFGLDLIDADSLDTVLDAVLNTSRADQGQALPVLVTPNVDIVVLLHRQPTSPEADVFRRARFVLPDGMPLVAASRLLGRPLTARLPGSGLFELLWPRLAADGRSAIVVCSSDEIARRLATDGPKAEYFVPAMFDIDDRAAMSAVVDEVMRRCEEVVPDFVLFGLGHPKDAILAGELCRLWSASSGSPLCLGLGGSFAMYTGVKKRAPELVQRLGFEWFYRFCQEPRRLFTRYFVRDMAFFAIVAREWRSARRIGDPG